MYVIMLLFVAMIQNGAVPGYVSYGKTRSVFSAENVGNSHRQQLSTILSRIAAIGSYFGTKITGSPYASAAMTGKLVWGCRVDTSHRLASTNHVRGEHRSSRWNGLRCYNVPKRGY